MDNLVEQFLVFTSAFDRSTAIEFLRVIRLVATLVPSVLY